MEYKLQIVKSRWTWRILLNMTTSSFRILRTIPMSRSQADASFSIDEPHERNGAGSTNSTRAGGQTEYGYRLCARCKSQDFARHQPVGAEPKKRSGGEPQ